jgi:hypothetical protein
MTSSCPSLLFFFLSVPEPLNPNHVVSPSHTHRCPLLLCVLYVHLHRAPSSASSTCASLLLHVDASLLLNVKAPENRTVHPTFTAALGNHRRDHAPPQPPGPHLPELFHLQQFGKPSPSLFPSPSVIMLRSLLIIRLLGLVICLELYKSLGC